MENYVQWERKPVKDCYHIYSDGTRVSVLFETSEDKVFARNLIAVLAFKYHIRVYCDVVMDTHLHLVGHGKPENVVRSPKRFIRFLFVKKKDITEQDEKIALSFLEKKGDAELHALAEEESRRLFGRRITKLTQAERLQVAGILWQERRTLSRKQLARAVRMKSDILEAVFH